MISFLREDRVISKIDPIVCRPELLSSCKAEHLSTSAKTFKTIQSHGKSSNSHSLSVELDGRVSWSWELLLDLLKTSTLSAADLRTWTPSGGLVLAVWCVNFQTCPCYQSVQPNPHLRFFLATSSRSAMLHRLNGVNLNLKLWVVTGESHVTLAFSDRPTSSPEPRSRNYLLRRDSDANPLQVELQGRLHLRLLAMIFY